MEKPLEATSTRSIPEAIALIKRVPREALVNAVCFNGTRRVNLPSFPYGVFYFIHDDTVIVLGVLHGARDTGAELARRRTLYG